MVSKSEEDWRRELSAEEYRILRNKGTEPPFSGKYDAFYPESGFFSCRACGNPLFDARSKFKSGCGWPAFDRFYEGSVEAKVDRSLGMTRIEILCASCGGHLGHVFHGERLTATNERHCVNSLSIAYVPEEERPADRNWQEKNFEFK